MKSSSKPTYSMVIGGATGEYSDRDEWLVAAYLSKLLAEQRVSDCERRARELKVLANGDTDVDYRAVGKNEHDPSMHVDYTGVRYYLAEVDLVDFLEETT